MTKAIEDSMAFAAKQQVWQRMILKIIRPMFIAMSKWQNSHAVLLCSQGCTAKSSSAFRHYWIIIAGIRENTSGEKKNIL